MKARKVVSLHTLHKLMCTLSRSKGTVPVATKASCWQASCQHAATFNSLTEWVSDNWLRHLSTTWLATLGKHIARGLSSRMQSRTGVQAHHEQYTCMLYHSGRTPHKARNTQTKAACAKPSDRRIHLHQSFSLPKPPSHYVGCDVQWGASKPSCSYIQQQYCSVLFVRA